MPRKPTLKTLKQLLGENADLRARLAEAKETLRAIRSSEVDALVVPGEGGEQIFTLKGADHSYRILIEDMSEGALILTAEGVILYANRRFAEMLKTPLEKVIGSAIHTWIAPDSQRILQSLLRKGLDEKRREQLILTASDGTLVPVYLSVSNLLINEMPDSFCLVATDLTEHNEAIAAAEKLAREVLATTNQSRLALLSVVEDQKQAERELQILSSRNQTMLEAIPDIIMEVDTNKTYTWANHAGIEFFGADVIGKEASHYFEGEQQTYQTVKPIFNGYEDILYVESWQRRRDGEKRLLAWWCRVLKDAAGNVTGILSSARDITEIKLAENEIRQLNEELEQRVRQRTAQLETSNKELEAFSYSVSHDLRAPLRAIDGFSRIVLEEYAPKLDDEGRRLLDVIAGNTHKMGQLIDDLLAFSHLSRQQTAFAPVDLAALAAAVFFELKNLEKGRRIEFKIGALPAAFGDCSLLRLVLQNLLANAIKFTRPRTRARIELAGQAGKGENIYHVKDNGVGFNMEYAHKLFDVFQRLHSSKEFEGNGVGLAIVQRIVLRHGGRVWAESGKSGGATFYFTLPAGSGSGAEAPPAEKVVE